MQPEGQAGGECGSGPAPPTAPLYPPSSVPSGLPGRVATPSCNPYCQELGESNLRPHHSTAVLIPAQSVLFIPGSLDQGRGLLV